MLNLHTRLRGGTFLSLIVIVTLLASSLITQPVFAYGGDGGDVGSDAGSDAGSGTGADIGADMGTDGTEADGDAGSDGDSSADAADADPASAPDAASPSTSAGGAIGSQSSAAPDTSPSPSARGDSGLSDSAAAADMDSDGVADSAQGETDGNGNSIGVIGNVSNSISNAVNSVSSFLDDPIASIESITATDVASAMANAAISLGLGPIGILGQVASIGLTGQSIGANAAASLGLDSSSTTGPSNSSSNNGGSNARNEGRGSVAETTSSQKQNVDAPDLRGNIGSAKVTGNKVEFTGKVRNIGKAVAVAASGKAMTSVMQLDYNCNGTIDVTRQFPQTHQRIPSGETRDLSVSFQVPKSNSGRKHCYAVTADVTRAVAEADERNNRSSNWSNFTVADTSSNSGDQSKNTSTQDSDAPKTGGPAISPKPPTNNTGNTQNNNFNTDSNNTATAVGDFSFWVRSMDPPTDSNGQRITTYMNTSGLQLTASSDYQSEAIIIKPYQHVAFKWSAEGYDSCFASFADIAGLTKGDTEKNNQRNSHLDVAEPSAGDSITYTMRCEKDDVGEERSITVTTSSN